MKREGYIAPLQEGELETGRHGYETPTIEDFLNDSDNEGRFKRSEEIDNFLSYTPELGEGISEEQKEALRNRYFEVLQKIFDEYMQGAGGRRADMVPRDRILEMVETNPSRALASYNQGEHIIIFRKNLPLLSGIPEVLPETEKGAIGFRMDTEDIVVLDTLSIFIHEQWHAVGAQYNLETTIPEDIKHQSGFSTYAYSESDDGETSVGRRLNEGFVQMMTFEVLPEFIRRVGNFHGVTESDAKKFIEIKHSNYNMIASYPAEVFFLKYLIRTCSEILDVPEFEIKNAFIRAYLHAAPIFGPELESQFEARGKSAEYKIIESIMDDSEDDLPDVRQRWQRKLGKIKEAISSINPDTIRSILEERENTRYIIMKGDTDTL